jgi:chemotaxis protein MotB
MTQETKRRQHRTKAASLPRWKRCGVLFLTIASFAVATGCASTGKTDEALQEWDRLESQNQALQERMTLLEERLVACNSQRLDSSAVIQFQGAMIEAKARVIESQKDRLSSQQSVIREQAQVINSQAEAVQIVSRTYNLMLNAFRPELGAGTVTMNVENGILRMNLSSEILFPSGSAELSGSGAELVAKVAKGLEQIPYQVVVAGHTDNVPIGGKLAERYATNWDLAAARAVSVIRKLEATGIQGRRLVAGSFGQYGPVASNDTAEGRAKNRRIEFRIVPIVRFQ